MSTRRSNVFLARAISSSFSFPPPFQFGGHQPAPRIDGVILLKGASCFILQLLELFFENRGLMIHFQIDALDGFQTGLEPVQ